MLTLKGYKIDKSLVKDYEDLYKDLTVKPVVAKGYESTISEYNILRKSKNYYYLPRFYGISRYGLNNKSYEECFTYDFTPIQINFKGELRDKQKEIINTVMPKLYETGGGIITLPCGYGKTILSLYITSLIKLKTLILVHKSFLVDQWIERIKEFIPDVSIGTIKQNKIDTNKDIVIGMIQSLSMHDYDPELLKGFGLIIIDECHHIAAKVFYQSLNKVNSKYIIGLSATPERKDGLTKVIKWYVGDFLYKIVENKNEITKVFKINFDTENDLFVEKYTRLKGKQILNSAKMETNITMINERNKLIFTVIKYFIEKDKNILILSGRVEHLKLLKLEIDYFIKKTKKNIKSCMYIGSCSQDERKDAEKNGNIIFATYSMAHEGLDIPRLNTVILTTPKSDVVQSIGRVMRSKNISPIIVDIIDNIEVYKSYSYKRLHLYRKNKYKIHNIYVSNKFNNTLNYYYKEIDENNIKDCYKSFNDIMKFKEKFIEDNICIDNEVSEEEYPETEEEKNNKKISKCLFTEDDL